MTPASPNPPFQVVRTPLASTSLKLLFKQARTRGILPTVLTSLRAIERFLTTMPREWGDPFRRLPGLNMIVYRRIFEQLLLCMQYTNANHWCGFSRSPQS